MKEHWWPAQQFQLGHLTGLTELHCGDSSLAWSNHAVEPWVSSCFFTCMVMRH